MNTIKKLVGFITDEPFIAATGFAAGVHSTWSFAVMFSGEFPAWETHKVEFTLMLLTSIALAFAVDVGQIKVSHDIRNGQRNAAKIVTFIVLAAGTYYLQWLYLVHHAPALALSSGVRDAWEPVVQVIRDAWVFVLPAFLPVATVLYTFGNASGKSVPRPSATQKRSATQKTGSSSGTLTGELADCVTENADETWTGRCPECAKEYIKPTEKSARNALSAHLRSHKRKQVAHQNGSKALAERTQ